jgi:lipopolysaccharide/colanic/teichoic acid biosynthesis glycosyltransferase/O-antigen/teichoic acid export membrane protein
MRAERHVAVRSPINRNERRRRGGLASASRLAVSNMGAQGGALAAVSVASLLVARAGGPAVVGEYALLRVLPWLFGVILSCGLPTASAFFMAGDHRADRRLRPTLSLLALGGAALGSVAWLACAIPFHALFFRTLPVQLVAVMAVVVITQLWTVTAKGCCQGGGDIGGANLIILVEELWFVPCYVGVLLLTSSKGAAAVVTALLISGTLATATSLLRLQEHGFFRSWGRPSWRLAKNVSGFGARGQLGNMLWLMNLRFDFILLGALAGPAALGIYAVASKVAELMRLAPTAINYVLYPRFTRLGRGPATREMRRLLPRATALTLLLTPVLAGAAFALPVFYGRAFHAAVTPAEIIVVGLSVEGAAAVASAYLLGMGRPGLNSAGMAVGATITVGLDVFLIPRYGAIGGAITSSVTYLATTTVLVILAFRLARTAALPSAGTRPPARRHAAPAHARRVPAADSAIRRAVDVLVAACLLVVASPLLTLIAAAVKFTSRGPAFYRQVRVGRSGAPFTILKFRSMVSGADRSGPLVTSSGDARVTRVGRLLRAVKLDELPQLVNVLRGDMTLIGPRPEVPRYLPFYREEELAVLQVRPGLTCLGQIFYTQLQQAGGSGTGDPEESYVRLELHPKLALDLDYLRHRSLRSDLEILARTVALLLGARRIPAALAAEPARSL